MPALNAPEQFCAGSAECLTCGHSWAAVWPLGSDNLVCPRCDGTDTIRELGKGLDQLPRVEH